MNIGFIGLGRMGYSMVERLLKHKFKVVAHNRSPDKVRSIARKGAIPAYTEQELLDKLGKKKIVWLMLPAGKVTDDTIKRLLPKLKKGDIIIDGANDFYKNAEKHDKWCKKYGVKFFDCGVSGGVWGLKKGYTLMIGGPKKEFKVIEPFCKALSPKKGYALFGPVGSGHFVKGIHNGIEYGMMGALNEGFEAIEKSKKKFDLNKEEIAKIYANGSIIDGKLTKWLWESFQKPKYLDNISSEVPKGETEEEMKKFEKQFRMPILHQARLMRMHTRKGSFHSMIISALRNKFGGHKFKKK